MAPVDVLEAEDRLPLPAPEALRNEERPDDFEVFGLPDDREIFVDELDVAAVFPVELDFDDDASLAGLVNKDGIGLPKRGLLPEPFIPRLDE